MQNTQELMHVHTAKEPNRKHFLMPIVIKPKFASTSNCPVPKCTSCKLACAKKCNPQVVQYHAIKEKEVFLALDKYHAGDFLLMDQFVVSSPGPLLTGYEREVNNNHFHGGTIFNDAATGSIWVASITWF